ncbi:hypothetical protein [Ramlibacter albus]|uniref:Uncharacterized protein n=1 Tax=Ramlibacter albus TaxID=2079448 RepID=A0A923MDP5_9BURK|nr:hypothetical protein [Ramlibacter albus]MBC5767563.1 hypothetical protein [Ramlibacter albus]
MIATQMILPQGPALLAKAGVTLADALWLLRQPRDGRAVDCDRLEANRRKVSCFLASVKRPARARRARA